jgi:hypothetical protein
MTPVERVQLDAFARVDGVWLSLLWVSSFACYIAGLTNGLLGMVALFLAVMTPFFVARRLRLFRDHARDGVISFMRGWAFVVLVFFYAGLLFALAQYAYFAFLDKGYVVMAIGKLMQTPEFADLMAQYGGVGRLSEALRDFQQVRPIDFALQGLSTNIMIGIVLGIPIAAMLKSDMKKVES